jgi:uncharacterized membrane-anchored protein
MNKRAKQFILAAMVPVLILLGMCFMPLFTLATGEEIILKTRPVDPSEVFRGDYVALSYEAEEIPVSLVENKVQKRLENTHGDVAVYVLLKKKDGIHTPVKVTLNQPDSGIYLKGTLNFIGENQTGKRVAFIQYSLDRYYVEDNSGTEWEKASIKGQILAKVKVKNGYAILTGITK